MCLLLDLHERLVLVQNLTAHHADTGYGEYEALCIAY
jgi:hypothetical protein